MSLTQPFEREVPAPLYVLAGNETLLLEEALDAKIAMLKQHGFVERLTYTVDTYFKLQDIVQLTQNHSLFAEKKQLIIHCEKKMPVELSDWIMDYCSKVRDYQDYCLIFTMAK